MKKRSELIKITPILVIVFIAVFLGIIFMSSVSAGGIFGNSVVIPASHAEHIDSNENFISDVYNSVMEKDNKWTKEISPGEIVRVTFEKNLANKNDITVYARKTNESSTIDGKKVPHNIYLMKKRIDEIRGMLG